MIVCIDCIYTYLYESNNKGLYIYKTDIIHMLSLEDIQKQLDDRNLKTISNRIGLSYMTIWKVKTGGKYDNFSYETIKKISDYLEGRP